MNQHISNIEIRLASPNEASSIAMILYASFVEFRSSYTQEAFDATTPQGDLIRSRFNEGPIWVAFRNSHMVGTVSAVPKSEGLYIRSMAVRPIARGYGIGRLLLEQVERFANDHGLRQLFLNTTPFLDSAIRLYENFGFQNSSGNFPDLLPHDLFDTPLITMVKALDPSTNPTNEAV